MPGPDDFPPIDFGEPAPPTQRQIAQGRQHDRLERLKYAACMYATGHMTLNDLGTAAKDYQRSVSRHCDAVVLESCERSRTRGKRPKQGG